nr:hypothetical protein [Pseudomonas sp.]
MDYAGPDGWLGFTTADYAVPDGAKAYPGYVGSIPFFNQHASATIMTAPGPLVIATKAQQTTTP